MGYLAATSRKLTEPLSVLIQSRSAAGKSTLQDAIISLIPDEEYIKYTRVTDQALFYKEEDSLVHKILAIEEAEGMGGAAYSIRTIQSAKKITVAATGKDANGRMKTEEYTVNGPVCVMITTTATEIDQETASRFIFLTIDESAAMTGAIHQRQREAETLAGLIREKKQHTVTRKHHAVQRMLMPLAVVNPYAEYLNYPSHSLRPGGTTRNTSASSGRWPSCTSISGRYRPWRWTARRLNISKSRLPTLRQLTALPMWFSVNPWMNWSNRPGPCYRRSTKW